MDVEKVKAEGKMIAEGSRHAEYDCTGPLVEQIDNLIAAIEHLQAENDTLKARVAELEEGIRDIINDEGECCCRCEGNGNVYADGKDHYMYENAPTVACPNCGGTGRFHNDITRLLDLMVKGGD